MQDLRQEFGPLIERDQGQTKQRSHQGTGEASYKQRKASLAALLLKTALAEENEGNKQNGQ